MVATLMADPTEKTFGQACTEMLFKEKQKAGSRLDQAQMIYLIDLALEDWTKAKKLKQKPRKKPKTAIEEDWLTQLQADPANKGIDVRSELARMRLWASNHAGMQPTRQRFINWLLKADRPISMHSPPRRAAFVGSSPHGWLDWARQNLPDWRRFTEEAEGRPVPPWENLEPDERAAILAQMK